MSHVDEIRSAVSAALGTQPAVDIKEFPSGAIAIRIRSGTDVVIIDGRPASAEWGVSANPEDVSGFTGHDHQVETLAAALELAKRELPHLG